MPETPAAGRRHYATGLSPDHWVCLWLVGFTLARTLALVISPLGLGVDEAQYWLWSQTPDFGYFTKPPMIAWIIGASHWLFGHHEAAVRLPAAWLHLATALTLWQATRWLYGPAAGRLTALIWITLPAVGLGSFLISTDTPLLLCVAVALLGLAGAHGGQIQPVPALVVAGTALGVGLLAKYAAVYALFGMMLIWASGRHGPHPLITGRLLLLALFGCLLAASPNLLWNLSHDFTTVKHLGDNANMAKQSHDFMGAVTFLFSQTAVAGPLVFLLMLGILPATRTDDRAAWLAWMALPALMLIAVQAYISEANANWAMAAYPALSIWLGGWLAGGDAGAPARWRRWLARTAIGVNGALCLIILITCAAGSLGPLTPASDPLRRLRGWDQLARDLGPELAAHQATRIIVDRRAPAALLHWHFHPTLVEIMLHDRDGVASNHFEANHSWRHQPGSAVLGLSATPEPPPITAISWQGNPVPSDVKIAANRQRLYFIHRGVE
jgi:hypothetical protein